MQPISPDSIHSLIPQSIRAIYDNVTTSSHCITGQTCNPYLLHHLVVLSLLDSSPAALATHWDEAYNNHYKINYFSMLKEDGMEHLFHANFGVEKT